jgi:carbon monoxide dehydrogenase subunit G
MRTTFPIDAAPEAWARLADPEVLAAILPGCRSVTSVPGTAGAAGVVETDGARRAGGGPGTAVPAGAGRGDGTGLGTLQVVVDLSVASLRGLWAGTVRRVDDDAVRIEGSGEPGAVDLVVRADPHRTRLTVEGTIEGPLATVGAAVLAAAVHRMAKDVLRAAGTPLPSVPSRGDGFRSDEPEAVRAASGTQDIGRSSTEPNASQGSAGPDDKAGSAGRRRRAVARVAAAAGVVAVVLGRWRRSRRRSG